MASANGGRREDGERRFLATTAPGLEELLVRELARLDIRAGIEPSGAVVFSGDWPEAARVLVRSRIASRVLLSLRRFACRNRAMLYDQVRRIDWPSVFPSSLTLAVEAAGTIHSRDLTLAFAPLRIKDGICDEFRKRGFARPDVDRRNPDVLIRAFFANGRAELSLDLSGEPLHKRGYRKDGAQAPIRENRAAALLDFAGYDGSRPFVDPFCGSGTLAIEAWLLATRTAPGLLRGADGFALSRVMSAARPAVESVLAEAAAERLESPPCDVRGSDLDAAALADARANAERAGAAGIAFTRADAREVEAPESWIVSNPPYGERLEDPEAARELLRAFVHRVKHHAVGSTLGLVLPRGALEKGVGLRPRARLAVESGPLGLRFLCYDIRAGRF